MPVAGCFDEMTGMLATTTGEFTVGGRNRHAVKPPWRHGRKAEASRSPPCGATPLPFRGFAAVMHDAGRARALVAWPSPRGGPPRRHPRPLRRRYPALVVRLSSQETRTCVQAKARGFRF